MPPRLHNALSYSVATLSLPIAVSLAMPARLTTLVPLLWALHFARRTAESLWVHRYSGRPVPLGDALIEYVYYWGFGAWIGTTWAGAEALVAPWMQGLGAVLFLLGEVGNGRAHLALRRLRARPGVTDRTLPSGGLFEWIDCPHYLFEILSWIGFAMATGALASWVFAAAVTGILASYARTRHRKYLEEFDGRDGRPAYPASRRALLPGIF